MEGYDVETVESANKGLNLIDEGRNYKFIICDIRMPGMDGIQFLKELGNRDCASIVLVISAYGTIETSIEAIKCGAADYINKPINTEELILRMAMANERMRLKRENLVLRKELGKEDSFDQIVYVSDKMNQVIELAKRSSEFKATVLITGESGTGKELFARAIHKASNRKDGPFVGINCAAIPESLLESELFGYVKGAFSNASRTRRGLFEEANGGTMLLDEIGEFPYQLQAKLLRVLQEEEIRRLGDTKTIQVDVRIIVATSRDLFRDVENGTFRDDLFYRLNVLPIHIPPLRERKEDIKHLVEYFISKYRERINPRVRGISKDVMSELVGYHWYGNIRELQNVIERAMILTDSEIIESVEVGYNKNEIQGDSWFESLTLDEAWKKLEKAFIRKVLSQTHGNRTKAAELLGLSRRALQYKLKNYGVNKKNVR